LSVNQGIARSLRLHFGWLKGRLSNTTRAESEGREIAVPVVAGLGGIFAGIILLARLSAGTNSRAQTASSLLAMEAKSG